MIGWLMAAPFPRHPDVFKKKPAFLFSSVTLNDCLDW